MKEVCQTLVYLHAQTTLHRDIKGTNIVRGRPPKMAVMILTLLRSSPPP